jgi:hypothetical protein
VDLRAVITDLEPLLSLVGSVCVIAGTIFVVIQLRMNARQAASTTAFDLIAKVTDPSFPVRRHRLYDVAARYPADGWVGFDRSLDDFEVRSFANIYEQLGVLVRKGMVELPDVMEALSAQILADWHTFQPIRAHIMEQAAKAFPALATDRPGIDRIYWPNFAWLATRNGEWVQEQLTSPNQLGESLGQRVAGTDPPAAGA